MALTPRPQVDIVARDTGDRLTAPNTNEALQLAAALADVAPEARDFAAKVAAEEQSKAAIRARADALKTSGAAFKDAVSQGLIERTQNPWYMSAYHKEAAQVDASNRLASLQEDAQTWEERGNSALFQDRLNREVGEIGASYEGTEAQRGFLAAANPVLQQVSAANTSRNVAQVNQERIANAATLATQAIKSANTANGGNATPAQIRDTLLERRDEFLLTGGTQMEWDTITIQAVTSAGYASEDPDLLYVLDSEELGNLASRPEVAGALASDRYRITQAMQNRLQSAEIARKAAADEEASRLRPMLIEQFGEALFTGDIDPVAIYRQYREQGFTFDGIQATINDITRDVQTTQSLQTARLRANALDPAQGLATINLFTRAQRDPLTPGLQGDIEAAYMRGDITQDDATRLIGSAQTNGEQLARAGARGGGGSRSGSSDAVRPGNTFRATSLSGLKETLGQSSAAVYQTLFRINGNRAPSQARIEALLKNHVEVYLGNHPGDYAGAYESYRRALAGFVTANSARLPPVTTPPPGGGRNRGGNRPANAR